MPLATGTITGTFLQQDQTPHTGTVELIPSAPVVRDDVGKVIVSGRLKVDLDDDGSFSVEVLAYDATSDPDQVSWTVVPKLTRGHLRATEDVRVYAGETVELSRVIALDPTAPRYAAERNVDAADVVGFAEAVQAEAVNTFVGAVALVGVGIDPTGVADSTAAIQAKIDSAPDGSLIYLPPGIYKCGNLVLQDKTDLTFTGDGTINWTGTAGGGDSIGIQLAGTLANVTISDLRLNGDGIAANRHAGVWNYSGTFLTNIKVLRNRITNVGLGISTGADGSGNVDGYLIEGNDLDNIVGTVAGTGYGLHHGSSKATSSGVRIVNNIVRRCQRHSIYQGKGSGTIISGNQIFAHRQGVAQDSERGAIIVARSTNVIVTGNVIDTFWDGGIEIAPDTGIPSSSVLVYGNTIRNQMNAVPALKIGSPAPAIEGVVSDVQVDNNLIENNGNAFQMVRVYSGKRIKFSRNRVILTGATGTVTLVDIYGAGETADTATYTDDVTFEHNHLYGQGGTDVRGIRLQNEAALSAARLSFLFNSITTVGSGVDVYGNVTITNPNIRIFGQPHSLSGVTLLATKTGPTTV